MIANNPSKNGKKKDIVNVLQTLVQWKIKVIKIDEDIVQVPFYDGCVVWMLVNIA
jgi:hypothetical protein